MDCCNDNTTILADNILHCSVCKGKHHFECLNLSSEHFMSLSNEYKAVWRCPSCSNVTRRGRSNADNPVRTHVQTVLDDTLMDMSCENIDHSLLTSSTSLGCNNLVNESTLQTACPVDLTAFTESLQLTLKQWRSEMNKDLLEIREDIKCTLNDIQREVQGLRAEQNDLKQRVSDLRVDVVALQASSQSQSEEHDELKKRVDGLLSASAPALSQSTIISLEAKLDTLEQQARQCNVEICNLPERRNENLPAIIEAIGSTLKHPILLNNIVAVHRVPHAHQQTTRPKNVIVKFTSRIHRDNLLSAFRKAKSLKTEEIGISGVSSQIYLNEHLTLKKKQLFRKAREVANKNNHKYVWISNGTVLVRERDGATAFAIRGESDLEKIKAPA